MRPGLGSRRRSLQAALWCFPLNGLNPVFCRYQDPDIDVQLSSELSGSLRTLKVLSLRVAGCCGDPVPGDDNHPCSPCPRAVGDTMAALGCAGWATAWGLRAQGVVGWGGSGVSL